MGSFAASLSFFAIVIGLNNTKKAAPAPLDALLEGAAVMGTGTELSDAVANATFEYSVMRGDGSFARAPGPVDLAEIAYTRVEQVSTIALDTQPSDQLLEIGLKPKLDDGTTLGDLVTIAARVNGGPVTTTVNGQTIDVELIWDVTSDLNDIEMFTWTSDSNYTRHRMEPVTGSVIEGIGVPTMGPATVVGETMLLKPSASTWTLDTPLDPDESLVAEIAVDGFVDVWETVVEAEQARVERVVLTAAGQVKVDALSADPGAIGSVSVMVERPDGSDGAEAVPSLVAADNSFSAVLSYDQVTAPIGKLRRSATAGIDMVVHSLDVDGYLLESQLLNARAWLSDVGGGVSLSTSAGAGSSPFGLHLQDPAVTSVEVELFQPTGLPVLTGPVVLERTFLMERHRGDLGRSWDFGTDSLVTIQIRDGGGVVIDERQAMIEQFGEILIDGVIWEVE